MGQKIYCVSKSHVWRLGRCHLQTQLGRTPGSGRPDAQGSSPALGLPTLIKSFHDFISRRTSFNFEFIPRCLQRGMNSCLWFLSDNVAFDKIVRRFYSGRYLFIRIPSFSRVFFGMAFRSVMMAFSNAVAQRQSLFFAILGTIV